MDNETKKVVETKKKKGFPIPTHWIAIAAFVVIFGVFIAFTLAFKDVQGQSAPTSSLSKEEMQLIVKELNPMQLQQLSSSPEQKKELTDQLKRLLAVAREAHRSGITAKPEVAREIEFIEKTIKARTYDEKVAAKPETPSPMPPQPFASISEEDVTGYWDAKDVTDGSATKESRTKEFKDFIDGKIAIGKATGQMPEDQPKPKEEELAPFKANYARTVLTYEKAAKKFASIPTLKGDEKKEWEELKASAELQIKLQKSQFLASYYAQTVLNKKLEVTDEEVEAYLKANPEIGDEKAKKKTADEVLKKLNDGGDFAALAKEFSEDPGSKENGGLYESVPMGRMDPKFEAAALALEPGTYSKELVKTNFGYHIIKLEKKTEENGPDGKPTTIYDVRHILVSTQISDPENPMSRPMSASDFAKSKLAEEREKKILDDIIARNPVNVPTDFEIPKPSKEDLEQLMRQQGPMPQMQTAPPSPPQPAQK